MYKLLIIDDDLFTRRGIRETIDWQAHGIEVCGEADNGRTGLETALSLRPDLIVCDVKMPVMNGVEFVRELHGQIDCAVVMLSGYGDYPYVKEAFEKGVFSYLMKPIDNDTLLSTVLAALDKLIESRTHRQYFDALREEVPKLKERFFLDVLAGRLTGEAAAEKAALYGIRAAGSFIVFCKPDLEEADEDAGAYVAEALKKAYGDAPRERAGEAAIFFLPGTPDKKRLETLLQAAADAYERRGSSFSVGVGKTIEKPEELAAALLRARELAENKLFPMLSSYTFEGSETKRCKPVVEAAMRYIAKNFGKKINAKITAEALFVSPSNLMHAFKDELNRTFNDCLTAYRIMTAKKFLREGCFKVYEIAEMIGYDDVRYFGQIFKQQTGMTPTEYAEAKRAPLPDD